MSFLTFLTFYIFCFRKEEGGPIGKEEESSVGNTLSQAEIDFLLNSGIAEAKEGKQAERTPVKLGEESVWLGPGRKKQGQPGARAELVGCPNPLGALACPRPNRMVQGEVYVEARVPRSPMWSAEQVCQLELARSAVKALLQLAKRFREKRSHGLMHEVLRLENRFGQPTSFQLLRHPHKPVRLKISGIHLHCLNHKEAKLERSIEWESSICPPDQFTHIWASWLIRHFDPPALERLAQLA
jgi:hypothetical protein